jgi:hypothetical protein|tara:strand:+ start:99 stop:347 length:249 start_codon:yes stop_codon:yes gene_type:complete
MLLMSLKVLTTSSILRDFSFPEPFSCKSMTSFSGFFPTLACQEEGLLYTNLEFDADDYEVEFDMAEMVELDNMSKRAQRLEK